MPQLDPTWFASQLFWLVISMAVLYVALSRFLLPPLLRVMEQRHATRMSDLERAQQLKTEAEQAKQEYEQSLRDARSRAQALFSEAAEAGKKASEKALADLARAASEQMAEAERRIAAQKHELLTALEPAAVELVSAAVEKLAKRKPDAEAARTAVHHILKKAG